MILDKGKGSRSSNSKSITLYKRAPKKDPVLPQFPCGAKKGAAPRTLGERASCGAYAFVGLFLLQQTKWMQITAPTSREKGTPSSSVYLLGYYLIESTTRVKYYSERVELSTSTNYLSLSIGQTKRPSGVVNTYSLLFKDGS